jgi:hypothetical protein
VCDLKLHITQYSVREQEEYLESTEEQASGCSDLGAASRRGGGLAACGMSWRGEEIVGKQAGGLGAGQGQPRPAKILSQIGDFHTTLTLAEPPEQSGQLRARCPEGASSSSSLAADSRRADAHGLLLAFGSRCCF